MDAVASLQEQAKVMAARADVCDRHAMKEVLEKIDVLPPFKGIFHAAGVEEAIASLTKLFHLYYCIPIQKFLD